MDVKLTIEALKHIDFTGWGFVEDAKEFGPVLNQIFKEVLVKAFKRDPIVINLETTGDLTIILPLGNDCQPIARIKLSDLVKECFSFFERDVDTFEIEELQKTLQKLLKQVEKNLSSRRNAERAGGKK